MALTLNHPTLKEQTLGCYMADSGTASKAYIIAPFRAKIVALKSVVYAAIGTANNVVTVNIGAGGTAITGGTLTQLTASSAAGDVVTATPTGANTCNEGDVIEFSSDGGGSNTTPSMFYATFQTN